MTPSYFEMLGIQPALGRSLDAGDGNAVLLDHGFWQRRYGGDPSVVGTLLHLDDTSFEITGVLPPDQNPNLTTFAGSQAAHVLWRLQPEEWTQGDDRSVGWLRSTARLADGVTLEQAQAEVDALMLRVNESVTNRDGGKDLRINVVPVKSDLVGGLQRTLWILLGAVCGVLLIAASNVAHLMLARGEVRSSEIAVRTALGGSRIRLMRQLLVEGITLALAGGLLGVALTWFGVRALLQLAPASLPRMELVTLDAGVLGFALAASLSAAVVFALVPAFRASRAELTMVLGERAGTTSLRQRRLSQGLVIAEVALSLALLVATGLLLRSVSGLQQVDLGFEREELVTFGVEIPGLGGDDARAAAVLQGMLAELGAVPGVQAAGFTNRIPLAGGLFTGGIRSEEMVAAEAEALESSIRFVTPGYFESLGARLVAGRAFRASDGDDRVLLDQTVAESLWPGESPLGRRIETKAIGTDAAWAEVIGVVAPMKHHGVALAASETLFLPMLSRAGQQNFHYAAVRVDGEPLGYLPSIKEALQRVEPGAVMARVRTMDDLFAEDIAATRFAALLLTLFGAAALLLAAVGLHGVMAVALRGRVRELGIRVALGARHGELLRGVLASAVTLVAVGIACGTLLSLGLGRFLSALLFEVDSLHLGNMVTAAAVMLAAGSLGSYLPARFVLSVDPARTLRDE